MGRSGARLRLVWLLAWVLIGCLAAGEAGAVPLPPRRPPELGAPQPAPEAQQAQERAAAAAACQARLAELGVRAEAVPPPAGEGECGIEAPVRLMAAPRRNGSIAFPERPLIDCRLAEKLAEWLAGVVAPVFTERYSSALAAVRTGPGYECRNRNRAAAGKISAHARGLALDISGFELADGRLVAVGAEAAPGQGSAEAAPGQGSAVQTVRIAACGWFTTVLGPGSDPQHATHLHLDILRHGSSENYRICQ